VTSFPDKIPMSQWLTTDHENGPNGHVGHVLDHFRAFAQFRIF
jgi:hypothetical protein